MQYALCHYNIFRLISFLAISDTETYEAMVGKLSRDWLLAEVGHNVSKSASDALWKVACNLVPKVYDAKKAEEVEKNVPQFTHIRRSIYNNLPPIHMKTGYKNKETGEVIVVESNVTPNSQYPRSNFVKVYEVAYVEVNNICFSNSLSDRPFFCPSVLSFVRPLIASCLSVCVFANCTHTRTHARTHAHTHTRTHATSFLDFSYF